MVVKKANQLEIENRITEYTAFKGHNPGRKEKEKSSYEELDEHMFSKKKKS